MAALLALGHGYYFDFSHIQFAQRLLQLGQVVLVGNQAGEPADLLGKQVAFGDETAQKRQFAAFTPQFRVLTAKIAHT